MYSIVMAAMITAGQPAPAFNGRFANLFGNSCQGCQGQCYGCTGGCQGCNGGCTGCNGCCGGFGFLGIRDYWREVFSFRGGCNGCNGGCQGCYGGCCGGYAGGCHGGMPMASYSCMGSPSYSYAMPITSYPMSGGMGYPITGDMGGYQMGGPIYAQPNEGMVTTPQPAYPQFDGQTAPMPQYTQPQNYQNTTPPNQATIIVNLPADAKMFVDGNLMPLTGPVRQFRSGDLAPNTKYSYVIRVIVVRNGKDIEDSQTVDLVPGKVSQVHFAEPNSPGSRAQITIQMPQGAKLFVDNQPWTPGTNRIMTPTLDKDQDYSYTIRIERELNGRKDVQTKEVSFRAGSKINVAFDGDTSFAAR